MKNQKQLFLVFLNKGILLIFRIFFSILEQSGNEERGMRNECKNCVQPNADHLYIDVAWSVFI